MERRAEVRQQRGAAGRADARGPEALDRGFLCSIEENTLFMTTDELYSFPGGPCSIPNFEGSVLTVPKPTAAIEYSLEE